MKIYAFFILNLLVACPLKAGAMYFHSDSYREKTDNPFLTELDGGRVYVENFETQGSELPRSLLTTPYATGWNGLAVGSPVRGVQEDFSGADLIGHFWTNNFSSPDATKLPLGIHFDFTPNAQGRLPDFAGAALLGRFDPNGTGLLFNSIFVYDKDGNEVTAGEWKFVRPSFAAIPADPADYLLNFYGVYVPGGISRIHFRDFPEVDHLTYGYSIPEPSTSWFLIGSVGAFLHRRRLKTS